MKSTSKNYPKSEIIFKNGGFAPFGANIKVRGFLSNWKLIAAKYDFKITDAMKPFPQEAMDMILYGGNEKFSSRFKGYGNY